MVNITKNLTNPQGSQLSLMESVGTAIGKSVVVDGFVEPMAISPLTGNNKLLNGVVEVVGAGLVGSFLGGNIFGRSISTAMMVSAGDNFASLIDLEASLQDNLKVVRIRL